MGPSDPLVSPTEASRTETTARLNPVWIQQSARAQTKGTSYSQVSLYEESVQPPPANTWTAPLLNCLRFVAGNTKSPPDHRQSLLNSHMVLLRFYHHIAFLLSFIITMLASTHSFHDIDNRIHRSAQIYPLFFFFFSLPFLIAISNVPQAQGVCRRVTSGQTHSD